MVRDATAGRGRDGEGGKPLDGASIINSIGTSSKIWACRKNCARCSHVLVLFLLYAVQGVPFGFIDNFLPLTLYAGGASLAQISLMGAIGLPWMFKWVWAPLVDAHGSAAFGRRKSWIVPSHVLMLLCCGLCASLPAVSGSSGISSQMAMALLLWAFATAVEDCAVDGFAISLVEDEAKDKTSNAWFLAAANFAQVVGFKAGYMYTGAPLWFVHQQFGWGMEMWLFMASPIACIAVLIFMTSEPKTAHAQSEMQTVCRSMRELLRSKRTRQLMALAAMYKVGEKIILSMFKPALVDAGYEAAEVGTLVGFYGTTFSTIGSVVASLCLPQFGSVAAALRFMLLLRACLFAASLLPLLPPQVAIGAQGLGSGIITPVMFAYLMHEVSGSACVVTHYTLLQCCDDLSRTLGQTCAGHIAMLVGYRATFGFALLLCILPLGMQP